MAVTGLTSLSRKMGSACRQKGKQPVGLLPCDGADELHA